MFPIQVKIIETKPPDIVVRDWRQIRRGTFRAMGAHWYSEMLPKHFAANAGRVYGYRRRTEKYIESLRRGTALRGGRRLSPEAATSSLTASGMLRRAALQSGRVIREFPTRFTVTMPGLPYTPRKPRSSVQPFLQGELTKLLKREINELQKVGKAEALRLIEAARARRETTV